MWGAACSTSRQENCRRRMRTASEVPKGFWGSITLSINTLIMLLLLVWSGAGGLPIKASCSSFSNELAKLGIRMCCRICIQNIKLHNNGNTTRDNNFMTKCNMTNDIIISKSIVPPSGNTNRQITIIIYIIILYVMTLSSIAKPSPGAEKSKLTGMQGNGCSDNNHYQHSMTPQAFVWCHRS